LIFLVGLDHLIKSSDSQKEAFAKEGKILKIIKIFHKAYEDENLLT
jgi:predicted Ser/Thr protein kinase